MQFLRIFLETETMDFIAVQKRKRTRNEGTGNRQNQRPY